MHSRRQRSLAYKLRRRLAQLSVAFVKRARQGYETDPRVRQGGANWVGGVGKARKPVLDRFRGGPWGRVTLVRVASHEAIDYFLQRLG